MDKKETTRLLNNLLEYNKVDINNIRATFPDLGNAFMNVVLAIDEEYGSGNIDRTLLRETKKSNFNEFGDSFIGKYLYKPNSKEWYYFDSITNYDEANQRYTFKIYTNNAFSNSNVAEEINWSKSILEELLNTKEYAGWKLFTLNVGDKVTLPKTKQGVAGFNSGALETARLRGQNYLYIVEIQKNGKILLWPDYIPANGDFFIMQDVEPYEEPPTNNQLQNLLFKVGDEFQHYGKGTIFLISAIKGNEIRISWTGNSGKPKITTYTIKDANQYFKDKYWILVDKNVPNKSYSFKVGDEFTTDVSRKLNYTYNYIIDKIDGDKVVVAWTDQKGKYLIDYLAKDAQELFDKGDWILSGKSTTPVTSQYSFKVGDSFTYSNKDYKIDRIVEETNANGIIEDIVYYKDIVNSEYSRPANVLEKKIKDGTYTLISASTSSANYITSWRPDWKAMGLRPSPTRKASLGKIDDVGLGNDGIVYEIGEDKKGTKKWKKKGFNYFNPNVRALFTTYDKNLLIDQLNYENSQLDKTDVDYKENEKLIKQVLTEI
jgi:hypothetical protein